MDEGLEIKALAEWTKRTVRDHFNSMGGVDPIMVPTIILAREDRPIGMCCMASTEQVPVMAQILVSSFGADRCTLASDALYTTKDFPQDHPSVVGAGMSLAELREQGVPGIADGVTLIQWKKDEDPEVCQIPYAVVEGNLVFVEGNRIDGKFEVFPGSWTWAVQEAIRDGFTRLSAVDMFRLEALDEDRPGFRDTAQAFFDKYSTDRAQQMASDLQLAEIIQSEILKDDGAISLWMDPDVEDDPDLIALRDLCGMVPATDLLDADQLRRTNRSNN